MREFINEAEKLEESSPLLVKHNALVLQSNIKHMDGVNPELKAKLAQAMDAVVAYLSELG